MVLEVNTREVVEKQTRDVELLFPYISEFLGFRESNAVISVLKRLNNNFDVLMVNGHGMMHPRGFGLASQVGVLLDVPTLGVAKRLIKGSYIKSDATKPPILKLKNSAVGAFINGNYVSIGHKISLKTAIALVLKTSMFNIPEPLRQAHILATRLLNKN